MQVEAPPIDRIYMPPAVPLSREQRRTLERLARKKRTAQQREDMELLDGRAEFFRRLEYLTRTAQLHSHLSENIDQLFDACARVLLIALYALNTFKREFKDPADRQSLSDLSKTLLDVSETQAISPAQRSALIDGVQTAISVICSFPRDGISIPWFKAFSLLDGPGFCHQTNQALLDLKDNTPPLTT